MSENGREIPDHLPEYLHAVWREAKDQVRPSTPPAAIEGLCRQLYLMRDAERRVSEEGSVVADAKGNATEHPAIKIQREAGKEVRDWLKRYAPSR
jgi:phage terminase small subunit